MFVAFAAEQLLEQLAVVLHVVHHQDGRAQRLGQRARAAVFLRSGGGSRGLAHCAKTSPLERILETCGSSFLRSAASSDLAVVTMTGKSVKRSSARNRCRKVGPSITGICKSRKITSGRKSFKRSSASWPLLA